jgi:hypothetical protein
VSFSRSEINHRMRAAETAKIRAQTGGEKVENIM